MLNNYTYREKGEDKENPGLLIPRYVATGRTSPTGKVYPAVTKKNEDELVPVRSIVTKCKGNLYEVTPDLLGKAFLKASFPDGSAIGPSVGTSFTESTTQGILALKHGGHERKQAVEGNLYAPKDCELIEDGKFLKLKVRGNKELVYPKPSNWVGLGKTEFKEGELVGTAYNTSSPIIMLNSVLKLMQAKGGTGSKYFEKDNVIISDCYAYEEGVINYVEDKHGRMNVTIGNRYYAYNPEAMYYYPSGTTIKKFQRFCSGVVNMRQVSSDLGGDLSSIFNIFRRQYYTLVKDDFIENGVGPHDMPEEIVEIVFAGLTNIVRTDKGDVTEVEFQGTQTSITNNKSKSFFTALSFGWSESAVDKAIRGELNLEKDTMTETVLGLLLNDNLDKV